MHISAQLWYSRVVHLQTALKRQAPSGLIFLITNPRSFFRSNSNLRSFLKEKDRQAMNNSEGIPNSTLVCKYVWHAYKNLIIIHNRDECASVITWVPHNPGTVSWVPRAPQRCCSRCSRGWSPGASCPGQWRPRRGGGRRSACPAEAARERTPHYCCWSRNI